MKSQSPISLELSAMGVFFRERFLNSNLIGKNGWTLFGSPTINNGLVLNGTTQYGRIELPSTFHSSTIFIYDRFTPSFAHDDGVSHYLFDSNPTGDYYAEKTAADALELYLGNTLIVSVAAGTYGAYWYQNLENILLITGTDSDTSIWLNGFEIVSSDATSWTPTQVSQFTVGATHAGGSFFAGTVHEIMFGDQLLDDISCPQLTKPHLLSRLKEADAVMSLPMNEVKVNAGEASYTPIIGTTGETEALLGSDGLTPSEMPALLAGGGFSFDGDDFITIADADEFTFSDVGGDLPFSICFQYKPGDASITATIISKYTGASNGEWTIYCVGGLLYFFITDQSVIKYIYQRINAPLINGVTETWVCTYNASALDTGLTIYRNGIIEAVTAGTVGPYTQMRNSGNNVIVGSNSGGSPLTTGSEVHKPKLVNYEMSATEALLWHEKTTGEFSGSIISEITEKKAIISLPLTEILVNDSGETYTPIYGSSVNKQALMGSDGLTPAEMPTLLPKGGVLFNGSQYITLPDEDGYTFSIPSGGDLPFSVCVHMKQGDATLTGGILSKYTASDREWLLYQYLGRIRLLLVDEILDGFFYKQTTIIHPIATNAVGSFIAVYNGSGSVSGISFYLNGVLISATDTISGSYTQMRNGSTPIHLGKFDASFLPNDSEIHVVEVFPYEMSAAQAMAWTRKVEALNRGR